MFWFLKISICTESFSGWKMMKVSSAQIFWFAIATLPIFQHPENVKISIVSFFASKRFNDFPKTFFWPNEGRWLLWLKISIPQKFWFCNSNAFPTSGKCKNFNFSLYTVPAEMLYLQKYLTNFQKLFFGWKMRKVAIVVENFKCADILVLQYNGTHFPTSRECKNFNFSFTLSQQKCYIFKSI